MHSHSKKLFDAQAVDGISELENVGNSRHLGVAIDSANSAELTVRFKGSLTNTPPDFSAAATPDNQWAYLALKNLQTEASIDGATGVVISGTDIHNMYEVNTNGIKFIVAEVSSRTVGDVDVLLRAFNASS